eukprot:GHVQ01023998.1.p1 GENE.GHVQ01023998.1~~GHVQ01023998.1.p1  ORF type:complete len:186 (-),score=39.95 GHVQ01023998.1:213-770(-)
MSISYGVLVFAALCVAICSGECLSSASFLETDTSHRESVGRPVLYFRTGGISANDKDFMSTVDSIGTGTLLSMLSVKDSRSDGRKESILDDEENEADMIGVTDRQWDLDSLADFTKDFLESDVETEEQDALEEEDEDVTGNDVTAHVDTVAVISPHEVIDEDEMDSLKHHGKGEMNNMEWNDSAE